MRSTHDPLLLQLTMTAHITKVNTYLYLPVYYKGYDKGYRWKGTEPSGTEPEKVQEEVQSLHPSPDHHSPVTSTCSPTWKFSKLHTLGIFMEGSSCRHDQLLTVSSPSPFPRAWGSSGKFQASNHGLVLLVTSHHPKFCRNPTRVISL